MAKNNLSAKWGKKEQDIMINYPRSCDGHWLAGILNKEFTDELTQRGYDITTLKFSVERTKE